MFENCLVSEKSQNNTLYASYGNEWETTEGSVTSKIYETHGSPLLLTWFWPSGFFNCKLWGRPVSSCTEGYWRYSSNSGLVVILLLALLFSYTLFENYSKCRTRLKSFWILTFSTIFCPIKIDLSGNTVWPQDSGFQKLAKMEPFLAFLINFCPLNK